MDQAAIVAYQKPITPHCYSPRGNHARIMKLVIIRRTMKLMVCQSLIILSSRITLTERTKGHMEYAIITLLYLVGFLVVGTCFFQLAGVLDKLVTENKALESDKV